LFNKRKNNKKDYSSKSSINSTNIKPLVVISKLENIKQYKKILKNKGGIYSIINNDGSKQYIGCAKDFYIRLSEHLNNTKSNKPLQEDIEKLGIKNFY
jgi:hypothetical protein